MPLKLIEYHIWEKNGTALFKLIVQSKQIFLKSIKFLDVKNTSFY